MINLKKIAISFIFVFLLIVAFNHVNAASDFDLQKLDFVVTLNQDGSMDVQETWQVKIYGETNTLFKTFKRDSTKYSGFSKISVSELVNGEETRFSQSNTWKNHVSTDYFHALVYNGDFEIAWGVNKSSGTHTYIVKYSVNDVVKVYNDCAELYWQFIGEDFEVPADIVTGTLTLPNAVEVLDNLRVWGHGQLNGDIRRTDNKTVTFTMSPFITGTYLEVRVAVLEPEMFSEATRRSSSNAIESIISEETAWADEANAQRERIQRSEEIKQYGTAGISSIIGAGFIVFIIKNIKKIKETTKLEPMQKLDYFRDIPNEQETPAEVAFLYYYGKAATNTVMPKVLSSTMLDLALKKYIEFEINEKLPKKEQVTVKLVNEDKNESLKSSEKMVYDLFRKIPKADNKFNMKEFEKYAKKHNESFLRELERVERTAKQEQEQAQNYDKKMQGKHDNWIGGGVGTFVFLAMAFVFSFGFIGDNVLLPAIAIIPGVIYAMTCFAMGNKYSGLTQKGMDEKEKWEALSKYMEDFSMIKDREVPELVLWEKYLVYATLFGNAEKVLKQLKVVYPEFANDEYMRNTTYFYLMTHTNFNDSFVKSVDTAMMKAYESSVAASSSSSGGGFGGGFSGGGGGRRRRWPAVADARQDTEKDTGT